MPSTRSGLALAVVGALLAAGCATPDPQPRAPDAATVVTTPGPAATGTSDPGTRLLPPTPIGALAVETPPREPAAAPPTAPRTSATAGRATPAPGTAPTAPPPRPSTGDDLGSPPTGGLPPPALR